MVGAIILGFLAGVVARILIPNDAFRHMSMARHVGKVVLTVPEGVEVRKVDLAVELQILAFHEQRRTDEPTSVPLNPSIGPDSLGEAINA